MSIECGLVFKIGSRENFTADYEVGHDFFFSEIFFMKSIIFTSENSFISLSDVFAGVVTEISLFDSIVNPQVKCENVSKWRKEPKVDILIFRDKQL